MVTGERRLVRRFTLTVVMIIAVLVRAVVVRGGFLRLVVGGRWQSRRRLLRIVVVLTASCGHRVGRRDDCLWNERRWYAGRRYRWRRHVHTGHDRRLTVQWTELIHRMTGGRLLWISRDLMWLRWGRFVCLTGRTVLVFVFRHLQLVDRQILHQIRQSLVQAADLVGSFFVEDVK